jgi:phage baseplate assembly protein W
MQAVRGFQYPFQIGPDGRIAMSEGIQHLIGNVRVIILTCKKEVPFLPNWGCGLARRIFDPVNAHAFAESEIRTAIERFEPRVKVVSIDTDASRAHEGILGIDVVIKQVGTEQTAKAYVEVGR